LALADIKRSAGRIAGQGMAVAGLVMGYVVWRYRNTNVGDRFTVRNTLRRMFPQTKWPRLQR